MKTALAIIVVICVLGAVVWLVNDMAGTSDSGSPDLNEGVVYENIDNLPAPPPQTTGRTTVVVP